MALYDALKRKRYLYEMEFRQSNHLKNSPMLLDTVFFPHYIVPHLVPADIFPQLPQNSIMYNQHSDNVAKRIAAYKAN